MFLNLTRYCVQESGPVAASQFLPYGQCCTRRLYSSINVCRASLRNVSNLFACGRVGSIKIFSIRGSLPFPADEMTETPLVTIEPNQSFLWIFRRGAIFHRFVFF